MATIYWKGTSTDPTLRTSWASATDGTVLADTSGEWNGGDLSAHDVIVGQFGNGALSVSAMIIPAHTVTNGSYAKSFKSLTIIERADAHSSYSSSVPVQFNGASITLTLGVGGLFIKKANCLQASHDTIIKFTGAVNSDNTYIKFDSSIDTDLNTTEHGMFSDSTNRSRFTFKFEPGTNITLELTNGVYPNLEGVASSNTCTLSATAPLNNLSTISYTTIDILNLTVDVNFKISPARQTEADFAKTFNLEGNLIIQTDTFFWGNSTVRFIPQNGNGSTDASSPFPVSGMYKNTSNYDFGNQTTKDFNAKYNKIIIGYVTNKKFILPASSILMCNHLEIESGGRLYGPDTTAIEGAEIHSIQRPTIHGDWNFTQIADGIYRTRKTLLPQQEYHDILSTNRNHYGINGDVLSITGGKLAWSSSAGGSSFAVSDITGATELASGLADADELVLSDGGVLKRMDISVLKTYMQAGLTFTTNTNTQNTTTLSFVDSSNDIILRNTTGGAGSGTDDIKFVAGSNITLTHTDADNITIASTDTNTDVDVSVANLKSALNSDFGGDVIFGSQTDDNVKYKGTVSIGDIDNAGSAKLSVNGFSTMNGLILGYGSGPGYIRTYNSSDNLELYAHNGTDHIKMIELDAANDTLTLGATGDTVTINDDLVVTGDLTVSGTTTTLNTATLDVEDLNITVGKAANSSSAANGAGLTFGAWSSGTIPTLTWVHADSRLAVNKTLYSSGGFVGLLTGNVTGNVSGNAGTVTLGSDNGSESHFLTFSDSATGSQALKTDDTLTYIPSSGRLTTNVFVGNLAGDVAGDVTGDLTGNADTVTNGVYTTGNQSIAGVKTFTSSPLLKAGLDLVNPNLAGAMGITLQNEDGKFLLYTDEGQLVIKDFLVDTGASTDGTDTFPFKLQSGAATDTFIIKTGGRVDVSGALHAGSFVGDVTGNAATATTATNANQLNATNDRDLAPEDLSYANDFQVFFTTKEGIEDGSTTSGGDYQDAIVLNTWSDTSGGDANLLAFDKSSFRILHYHADQAASNWGTAKQLAYTDSDITGNAATATTVTGAAQTNITSLGTLTALEVAGNTTGNVQITIDNDNAGGLGTFALQENGSTTGIFQYRGSTNGTLPNTVRVGSNVANGSLAFTYAGGTTGMYIKGSDGNVGIGTTSPDYTLDVAGNIGVDNIIYHNGDGNTYLNFQDDDFRIVVGNDLAFHYDEGSASKLHLSYNGEADVEIGNAGGTPDFFFSGSQGSYNGNMGIGTTSPASLLHVGSTAYELSSGAYLTSSHQRTAKMVIHADDANTDWDEQEIGLALHNEDPTNNNWSPHIAFTTHEDDDGDPTNANPVAVAAISATYNTRVANGWAKGDLVFFTNGGGSGNAERMRITSAGKVGIGTTAPEHGILEVVAPLDPSGSDTTFTYATTLKLDVEDSDSAEGPAILFRHGATGDHNAADYYFQVNGDGGGMSAHEYANNWGYAKWFHGAGADGHKPLMKISYGGSTNSGAAMYGTLQLTSATAAWDVFDGGHTGLHPTSFTTGVYLNAGGNSYINGGNLGINTTSPASQLDISSASTATLRLSNSDTALTEDQITGEIIFYQNDDSSSADGITGRIGMRSAKRLDGTNYYGDVGDMGFFVAGSGNYTANTNAALEAMTIRAGGKVGIGTTTPSTALQVDGTVTATAFAGALTGNVTGNADTATLATTVTVGTDNADATHYINFTDDNTGANAIKVNTGLTYNPSSNKITATRFEGALIGNADTVTNGVYTSGDQTIAGVKTLSSYMILTGDTTAAPSDLEKVHVGEDSGQLKIRTQYGTIQLGSTSSSWNHILGSQGRFYFNEPIIINGNGTYGNLSSYSTEDLILGTNSGTETRITIKQDTGNVGIGVTAPTDTLAVRGGIKIGEFNDTDGTGYAGTSPPSAHNLGTGASDPQIRVSGRSTGNPGIIQLAQFDANNFLGGTTQFVLGQIQFAMNENTNAVTTVAEIRGISSDPNVPGHFDGALQFWTSQGDSSSANLTQKMTLDADGNLGIGETAPSFPLHLKYTDNRTDPQGSNSSSGAGAIGANAQGGGLYIENTSTTDGSFAGITFRTDTADGRIAYQSTGSSLINEGQMSFYCDANDTGGQQLVLEEVLRLTGGGSGAAQAYNSAYVNGRLGVGITSPTHNLHVNGSFTATTKEFTIPHPTKKGMTLSHGSLEGPEFGVYIRGKSKDRKVYLPDYWKDLVHEDSITVQLTPIGKSENLYVVDYNTEYIEVENDVEYFYYVQAERKDVDKLEVET